MTINLREQAETDLSITLESDFALPVELISPEGLRYPSLPAQIAYDAVKETEAGTEIIVIDAVVVLRISQLVRIPLTGENWAVRIPGTPNRTAALEDYTFERPPEPHKSIGVIKLFLVKATQS